MNSSKYNFSEEYQKAFDFLKVGCECGCSSIIPQEKFARLREKFQNLSKKEKDTFLMAQLIAMDGGTTTLSPRFKNKERTNRRTFYCFNYNTSLCQKTYLNMLGIGKTYLENVRNHLLSSGLLIRIHGNTGRTPQWKTKTAIDRDVAREVKNFLLNYAEKYGLPDPGRASRITNTIIYLPTDMSYKSVHRNFVVSCKEDDKLKSLKYEAFRRLWHQLTPHIQFMNPRTDLCNTCQQFRNELHSCSNKSEVEKEELKKISSSTKSNIS